MNISGSVLDLALATLTGWIAVCLFALFVITSRKLGQWIVLPGHIRWSFLYVGWLMMVRSVNLISLHEATEPVAGRANLEAVAVMAGVAYLISSLTFYVARRRLPPHMWDRLAWFMRFFKDHPDHVAVPMSAADVAKVAQASGMAAVGPEEPPAAVYREGPRLKRAYDRRDRVGA